MGDKEITFKDYVAYGFVELPEDFSLQKAISWVDQCTNKFNKTHPPKQIFDLLVKLITTYSGFQEFRNAIANKVQKIILMCISVYSSNEVESSLECLEIILLKYGNASFLSRDKIAKYLEKFLCSSSNIQIINKAGNAYHLLQQVGNAGKDGATHKKQWIEYVKVLCKTINKLYDEFFANIREYNKKEDKDDIVPFDCVLQPPFDSKTIAQRLRNVIIFIKCAILKQYSVEKSLDFLKIFYIITRGLAVDEYTDNSSEKDEFLRLLYTLQINLLHLLKGLIICATPGIRKHSDDILKLLTDCLKRTDKKYFKNKSIFQTTLYGVLNCCISLEKENLSSVVCDIVLSHVSKEILNVGKPLQEGNKNEEIMQMEIFSQLNIANHKLTVGSIKCMEAIHLAVNLVRNAVLLNEAQLDVLYKFIMDHLFMIRIGHRIPPYAKYPIDLYKLLNAFCALPNYHSVHLLNYTIDMLTNDASNKNEETCIYGLQAIANLVNPGYPSLTFVKSSKSSNEKNIEDFPDINSISFFGNTINSQIVASKKRDIVDINNVVDDEPSPKRSKVYTESTDDMATSETVSEFERNTSTLSNSLDNSNILSDDDDLEPPQLEDELLNTTDPEFKPDTNSEKQKESESHINVGSPKFTKESTDKDHNDYVKLPDCKDSEMCETNLLVNETEKAIKEEQIKLHVSFENSDEEIPYSGIFKDVPNEEFRDII